MSWIYVPIRVIYVHNKENTTTREGTEMTRFQRELNGELGTFWKDRAKKELERIQEEFETGKITVDKDGIARNCIGRILMDDMLEKLAYITDEADAEATRTAREEETAAFFESYRKANRNRRRSAEELHEMRAAFGTGTTVVDIITGERVRL
jgi:hypothetical protein